MGSIGSRGKRTRRITVEELPCLPIGCVKNGGWPSNFSVVVIQEGIEVAHRSGCFRAVVRLVKTHQRLGGYRIWFQCPSCEDKRTKLYLLGHRLVCRGCANLAYRSSQMADFNRYVQQIGKVFDQLEQYADNPFFSPYERPKGMHRKAYTKLAQRLERNRKKAFGGLMVAAKSLLERLAP